MQGCLQLRGKFSASCKTAAVLHFPKGHGFLRNLLLRGVCTCCEDSLCLHLWQKLWSGHLQQCLCFSCSLPSVSLKLTHLSGFHLVYSNILWDKARDKLPLMLKGFLFLCFEKAFKKSNKYLRLNLVSALGVTVNLSLGGVIKRWGSLVCLLLLPRSWKAIWKLFWVFGCDCTVPDGKVFGDSVFIWQDFRVKPTSWFLTANPTVVAVCYGSWALLSVSVTTNMLSLQLRSCQLESLTITRGVTPVQTP